MAPFFGRRPDRPAGRPAGRQSPAACWPAVLFRTTSRSPHDCAKRPRPPPTCRQAFGASGAVRSPHLRRPHRPPSHHLSVRQPESPETKDQGKKVVIIGGTSGMGLATAKMLLDGDARVLVTGRSQAGLEA